MRSAPRCVYGCMRSSVCRFPASAARCGEVWTLTLSKRYTLSPRANALPTVRFEKWGIYQKKPVPRTLGTLSSCTEVSNNDNVNGFVPQIASLAKQLEQTASSKEWLELQVLSLQKEMESMGAASSTAPAGVSPSKAEVMKKLSLLRVIGCAFYSGRVSPSISGVDKLMATIG